MLLKLEDYGYKVDSTDPEYRRKEAILAEEGRIIRMPFGKEKLRAIFDLWLHLNPANREEARLCALDAKEIRKTRANKFGASTDANSGIRRAMVFPTSLMRTIEAFETEVMKGKNGKKDLAIIKQAFPEFQASEVF